MKKLVTFLGLGLIISTLAFANGKEFTWHDMEVKYPQFYEKVLEQYDAERLEDLYKICSYAEEHDCSDKLTWDCIKKLLDNPTEL